MEERVGIDFLLKRLPHTRRALQAMAARGDIPSAGKIGALWTFDPVVLGRWIKIREREACRTTSKSAPTASYTSAPRLLAEPIDEAYERAIGLKPSAGQKRSGRNSKASAGQVGA